MRVWAGGLGVEGGGGGEAAAAGQDALFAFGEGACVREAGPVCDGGVTLACGLDSRRHTAVTLAAVGKGGVARNWSIRTASRHTPAAARADPVRVARN